MIVDPDDPERYIVLVKDVVAMCSKEKISLAIERN